VCLGTLGVRVGDIITVAGNGTQGDNTGIGGPAAEAELYDPTSVAVNTAGDLFITSASEVLEIVESTSAPAALGLPIGDITVVAGQNAGGISGNGAGYAGDGGAATAAELDLPEGLALDAAGDLFIVADSYVFEVPATTSATSVTVAALAGSAVYGQPVTFTLTVTGPAGVTPTGTVNFTDNGTILSTATLNAAGSATLTTSSPGDRVQFRHSELRRRDRP
jgi:hypothetical protein